ncbi:proline rich transmembrane protein 1B-like [Corticium candelabrum]|uniref:proline rich transmembrane protein 1B-like n=1 Tax=Corticium candelabrum TaxID=121492 RepID=UPI002E25DDEF|nr:proline rich transmembrane protein 1B-like [Corticium candelabrum]
MDDAPPQPVDHGSVYTPPANISSPQQNYVQYTYRPLAATAIDQRLIQPKDYFVLSLLTTFFCCFPLGCIALMLSTRVRECKRLGEYGDAVSASKFALRFNIAAIISGVIFITVIIVVIEVIT